MSSLSAAVVRPPDPERIAGDLAALAAIHEDGPGWTRRVFGEADRHARETVAAMMAGAGLDTAIDAAGNVIGVLRGEGPGRGPALVTGSHTDTVAQGGRFDGIIGVVGAIEAVRMLRESGIRLHHDLLVADFLGEEPNDYGLSCVGSRAVAGTLTPAHLGLTLAPGGAGGAGPSGSAPDRLADGLVRAGADPEGALRAAWAPGSVLAYLELHIEQGPHLEALGAPLGVVTSIVGIQRVEVTYRGRPDHAGTMPMALRHDAGCAAAAGLLAVERLADEGNVATVGVLELSPGATNVIPGRARLLAESRSVDPAWLAAFRTRLAEELAGPALARGVEVELEWLTMEPPTPMAASMSQLLTSAAGALGHRVAPLVSFAGHDAVSMAHLGPTGMVFVPSKDGRSHCPEEWTDVADIAVGVHTLAQALVGADRDGRAA
jgi:N-carbamoyl-L-amino-acid hydrolase